MSATGRGAKRAKNDFYETPAWCVRRYLEARAMEWPGNRWLEPSAGTGAIIHAVNAWCATGAPHYPAWTAVEINTAFNTSPHARHLKIDFLSPEVTTSRRFDMCIGNPPYKLAQQFVERALLVANRVAFLLRLNFLESAKRVSFFNKYLCNVYVLPNRPSFTPDGRTDATAYAWFEWGLGLERGKLHVLAATSKAERLADRVRAA